MLTSRRFLHIRPYGLLPQRTVQPQRQIQSPSSFPVGETPNLKFFTLDGVVDLKTSPDVYFAPFSSNTWIALLASAGITLVFEISLRAAILDRKRSLLWCILPDSLFWKLVSFVGQYSSSCTPRISDGNREHQKYLRSITVTAVAWLVSSFIIFSNYGAYFSAESLREFAYTSEYERLMDLAGFKIFYLLDEQNFELMCKNCPSTDVVSMADRCNWYLSPGVQECELVHYSVDELYYYRAKDDEMDKECRLTRNQTAKAACQSSSDGRIETRKLLGLVERLYYMINYKSSFLRSNPETLEQMLDDVTAEETAAAFLSTDYEFRHHWKTVSEIMQRRPDLKIANNFRSDDNFGVREVGFWFTSGMHEPFRRRFVGRMEALLSSGIYGLWNKWQRIRFSGGGGGGLRLGGVKLDSVNGMPGDPVSFDNSALFWIFWAQSFGWIAAFTMFAAEVVWTHLWPAVNCWGRAVGEVCFDLKNWAMALIVTWFWFVLARESSAAKLKTHNP